jgi:hypothetical protein
MSVGSNTVMSKDSMNVLGFTFDTKLSWSNHLLNVIMKSKKALNAIKMI